MNAFGIGSANAVPMTAPDLAESKDLRKLIDERCNQEQTPDRPYRMHEEKEKAAAHHFEQGNKFIAAADFLRSHPEFEQFINLIRQGAIQF